MAIRLRRFVAVSVVLALCVALFSGCSGSGSNTASKNSGDKGSAQNSNGTTSNDSGSKGTDQTGSNAKKGAPKVIVFGTHYRPGDDPDWKDPVTGKPGMSPDQYQARKKAEEAVLNQMNVQIKWIQYPSDVREALLKSVLAKAPICDVCLLWGGSQGTLLGQNIFQSLDQYKSIFSNPDDSWMFGNPMFGHTYFLNYILSFVNQWPLVFNIQYLEKVPALKKNGKTVLPTDLWKEGKWTWSEFEDYLTKVNAYYKGKMSPVRTDVPIKSFETDYRYTAFQAIHSNGGAVYGAHGLTADAPEAKQAVKYLDGLMSKGLMMSVRYGSDTSTPGWTWNGSDFGNGESVFTNMVPWISNGAGQSLAKRGQSMGVVPFPRPDNISANDPKYQNLVFPNNQMAVLKGISKQKTETALKAYRLYWSTVYQTLANSNKALDYLKKGAENDAIQNGFDVTNKKYGQDILAAYKAISGSKPNEFATVMPWSGMWTDTILGNSLYGLKGSPKYATAIDEQKSKIQNSMSALQKTLSSGKAVDNMPPSFSQVKPAAVAEGSKSSSVKWGDFVKANDGIDGDIPFANVKVDTSAVKFDKVGKYDKGLAVSVKDKAGNEANATFPVIVYDPNNKTAPTIEAKKKYRDVKVGEDASKINWANDFVDKAVSTNGFDLKGRIKADISSLDVTTAGKYPVTLTVTDYAGNKASLTIKVKVVTK